MPAAVVSKTFPNINDNSMFTISKVESTLFNDCVHTGDNDGISFGCSLRLKDSSNFKTISDMIHQFMDPSGEYLEPYRCAD